MDLGSTSVLRPQQRLRFTVPRHSRVAGVGHGKADGAESVSAASVLVVLAAPAWAVTEQDDQFLTTMSGPGWTISSPTEFTGYAHMVCDEGSGDEQERRPPAQTPRGHLVPG